MTEMHVVLIISIIILGYIGSLWINPWVKCSRCGGGSTKKGFIFSRAYRPCSKCKGTGRQLRFGRRFTFGPPK